MVGINFMPGRYFATELSAQDLGLLNSLMSGQAAYRERRGVGFGLGKLSCGPSLSFLMVIITVDVEYSPL